MKRITALLVLLAAACSSELQTVKPGRGVAAEERGSVATVYPKGEEAREDRHGLWTGYDSEDRRRWEIRYTRGNPAGPYREWAEDGRLLAEWAYNWEGILEGEARWYDEAGTITRREYIVPDQQPDFDPIGQAAALKEWVDRDDI